MKLRALLFGGVIGLVMAIAPSCGPSKPVCGPATCAGCCDADGECQPGVLPTACGATGGTCSVCAASQFCQSGFCAIISSTNDGGTNDGGEVPDGGGVDAGGQVLGFTATHYVTSTGVVDVPDDSTSSTLSAWTLNGAQFEPLEVTRPVPGQFLINAPPGAEYYVQYGRSALVTTARSLDLGWNMLGRADAADHTNTNIVLDVSATSVQPWKPTDALILMSESAGESGYASAAGVIPDGATSFANQPFEYNSYWRRAMDASKGDSALLVHLSDFETVPGTGEFYTAAVGAMSTGPISLSDNQGPAISGAFQPLSPKTLNVVLPSQELSQLAAAVHPQAARAYSGVTVIPIPGTTHGYLGYLGELLSFYDFEATSRSVSLGYGNPNPQWVELGALNTWYQIPAQLAGAQPGYALASVGSTDLVSNLFSSPMGTLPKIAPPQSVTVNGANGQQPAVLPNATPLIAWTPPSLGTPDGYIVVIRELYANSSGNTRARTAGSVFTTGTSVRIPPGMLQSGKSYVLTVGAHDRAGGKFSFQSAPFYDSLSYFSAEIATSQLDLP